LNHTACSGITKCDRWLKRILHLNKESSATTNKSSRFCPNPRHTSRPRAIFRLQHLRTYLPRTLSVALRHYP
jgi:hypothetical protein